MTRERLYNDIGQDSGQDIVLLSGGASTKVDMWAIVDRRSGKATNRLFKEYKDTNQQMLDLRAAKARRMVKRFIDEVGSRSYLTEEKMRRIIPSYPIGVGRRENGQVGIILKHIFDHGTTQDVSGSNSALIRSNTIEGHKLDPIKTPGYIRRLAIAEYLSRQVYAIHKMGLVHADLAPRNVLMQKRPDGSYRPILIDLDNVGLLQYKQGGGFSTEYLPGMTPIDKLDNNKDIEHAAPELTNPHVLPSQATDLWSLATLLYLIIMEPNRPFALYENGTPLLPLSQIMDKHSVRWPPRGGRIIPGTKSLGLFYSSQRQAGPEIMGLFARVFDRPANQAAFNPSRRPTAEEWIGPLRARREELKRR